MDTFINYCRDDPRRLEVGGNDPSLAPRFHSVTTRVANARLAAEPPRLETHGFEIANHTTRVSLDDFATALTSPGAKLTEAARAFYFAEMENFVASRLGSPRVVAMHYQLRHSDPSRRVAGCGEPASSAHCDYDVRHAMDVFSAVGGSAAAGAPGRFLVLNAWRNVLSTPIVDSHLAMCDARSVCAPDDFVPCGVRGEDGVARGSYQLSAARASRHRWSYFPFMEAGEVLLFVQYDSDPAAPARFAFHSAVRDPEGNDSPRASIELRMIAFFPGGERDTIPRSVATFEEAVDACVEKIFTAMHHPGYWPAQARSWAKVRLAAGVSGATQMMREIIDHGARDGHYGLRELSSEQRRSVFEKLSARREEFLQVGKRNFP